MQQKQKATITRRLTVTFTEKIEFESEPCERTPEQQCPEHKKCEPMIAVICSLVRKG